MLLVEQSSEPTPQGEFEAHLTADADTCERMGSSEKELHTLHSTQEVSCESEMLSGTGLPQLDEHWSSTGLPAGDAGTTPGPGPGVTRGAVRTDTGDAGIPLPTQASQTFLPTRTSQAAQSFLPTGKAPCAGMLDADAAVARFLRHEALRARELDALLEKELAQVRAFDPLAAFHAQHTPAHFHTHALTQSPLSTNS